MLIKYRDHLGYIIVTVNEYGISFDSDKGIAIFEDEDGEEYRVPIMNICAVMEG